MAEQKRTYRDVTYGIEALEAGGIVAHMTSWAGQCCRLTTVKPSEEEAVAAAERWVDRALRERVNPDAPTYRWVADPEQVLPSGFVCAVIGDGGPAPVLE